MKTQYVTDDNGKKVAIILPIDIYQKMLNELEEMEDIKLYDKAKQSSQEYLDAEQAFKEIDRNREKIDF